MIFDTEVMFAIIVIVLWAAGIVCYLWELSATLKKDIRKSLYQLPEGWKDDQFMEKGVDKCSTDVYSGVEEQD